MEEDVEVGIRSLFLSRFILLLQAVNNVLPLFSALGFFQNIFLGFIFCLPHPLPAVSGNFSKYANDLQACTLSPDITQYPNL